MAETNDFICPHCEGYLNARKNIIFIAEVEKGNRGIILLSPEIGDYTMIKHPKFQLTEGEEIQLFCPICHTNLVQKLDDNKALAKIYMIDKHNTKHEIHFSGIVGERSTFKVTNGEVESFGIHSSRYIDFFNLSEMR